MFVLLTLTHWIAIYPVGSVIQSLNNWGSRRILATKQKKDELFSLWWSVDPRGELPCKKDGCARRTSILCWASKGPEGAFTVLFKVLSQKEKWQEVFKNQLIFDFLSELVPLRGWKKNQATPKTGSWFKISDEHPRPFDMRVPREISPSAFSISKTSWFPKVDEIHGIVRRFTGAGCFFQAYSLYLVADYTRGCFLPRILCQSPFCLSVCRSIDGRRDWQTMISFDNGHRLSESRLK